MAESRRRRRCEWWWPDCLGRQGCVCLRMPAYIRWFDTLDSSSGSTQCSTGVQLQARLSLLAHSRVHSHHHQPLSSSASSSSSSTFVSFRMDFLRCARYIQAVFTRGSPNRSVGPQGVCLERCSGQARCAMCETCTDFCFSFGSICCDWCWCAFGCSCVRTCECVCVHACVRARIREVHS